MYNPTLRLFAVLELLQSRREVSASELAQLLEVDTRSIRRYIMMLRDMGIPVEGEPGRHGGYSLRPGFRLPPLMFNPDEITAVMMGLLLLRDYGTASLPAIETAAAKIERVLPAELSKVADALRKSMVMEAVQPGTYPISNDTVVAFSQAIYRGNCLNITYQSGEGDATDRMIAPYGLVLHAQTWYIPAYCYLRHDMRIFRLDRIRTFARAEDTFTRPADFNPRDAVLYSLATMPGIYIFEILIHAPLTTVQEVVSPSVAVLEDAGARTLMRCYSDDPHWLARYLTRLELPFTVRATDELREALRVLAEELLKAVESEK